jgi:hypothetical protein
MILDNFFIALFVRENWCFVSSSTGNVPDLVTGKCITQMKRMFSIKVPWYQGCSRTKVPSQSIEIDDHDVRDDHKFH